MFTYFVHGKMYGADCYVEEPSFWRSCSLLNDHDLLRLQPRTVVLLDR